MDPAITTIVIMVITAVLLVTEWIPAAATAVLCAVSLALTGILTPAQAFAQFASTNIVLFAAMFILGQAFYKCGLAGDIASYIRKFSKSEKKLVLAVLLVSGVLSAFMSNTTTTAVFLPLIIGLASATQYSRSKLLYTMMASVGMGGCVTFLGGPGWLFTKAQIEAAHPDMVVSMFEVAKVTLPLFIITVIYMMVIGYKLIPDRAAKEELAASDAETGKEVPAWQKKLTLIVMVLTILCMLFSSQLGLNTTVIAVIGALIIVLSGVMSEAEAYRAISWRTLFLFGGLLPLSTALTETGAGSMIANAILNMMGNTTNPYIITAVCMLIPCVLSQFISNNTCMTLFTPLGVSVALAINADPTAVIMAISVGACIAIATPIGQPGNAMIYGPSGLRFSDYARPGLPLTIILYLVSVLLIPNVWPFF
ncbi:MAG: SLC13 family permease [Clostridia bacterium]|nr:SLC13 family permease [Clostridia bacterium]